MTLILNILAATVLAVLIWLALRGPREEQSGRDR